MSKNKGFLTRIFGKFFSGKIENIESALDNDPKVKSIAEKLDESLAELEKAADDYIDTEMYD